MESDIMELLICFGLPGVLPRPLTFSRAPHRLSGAPRDCFLSLPCHHPRRWERALPPRETPRKTPDHGDVVVQSGYVLNNKKYGFIVICLSLLHIMVRRLWAFLKIYV